MHSVSVFRPRNPLTERKTHAVSVFRPRNPLTERKAHSVSGALPGLGHLWTRHDAPPWLETSVLFVHALTLKPCLALPAWGILFHVCIVFPEGAA